MMFPNQVTLKGSHSVECTMYCRGMKILLVLWSNMALESVSGLDTKPVRVTNEAAQASGLLLPPRFH